MMSTLQYYLFLRAVAAQCTVLSTSSKFIAVLNNDVFASESFRPDTDRKTHQAALKEMFEDCLEEKKADIDDLANASNEIVLKQGVGLNSLTSLHERLFYQNTSALVFFLPGAPVKQIKHLTET